MTASVPVEQALAQAREIEALTDEVALSRISFARADGALADAATVPTGDLERGIRALTAERDGLKAAKDQAKVNYWLKRSFDAEADVKALAEALSGLKEGDAPDGPCWCSWRSLDDVDVPHGETCHGARAALARDGVRRGRGEGKG